MANNAPKTAQHTPGPWLPYKGPMNMDGGLNPFFRGIVALLKHSGEDDDVVVILDRNESAADYEANANLIAAAPELLQALIRVKHDLEYTDDYGDELDALIAKATGATT